MLTVNDVTDPDTFSQKKKKKILTFVFILIVFYSNNTINYHNYHVQ